MTLSFLSATTSTQDLSSLRTSMSMFGTRVQTPSCKGTLTGFLVTSPLLPTGIPSHTRLSVRLTQTPQAEWRAELFVLHEKDIHGMSEPSLPDHPDPECASMILGRTLLNGGVPPDGNHSLSRIWRGAPTSTEAVSGYNECLFVFPLQLFYF